MTTPPRTLIVVGGGIVARCCALALQRAGVAVTLVATPDEQPASWGNAGHIATEQVEPLARFATLRTLPRSLFPHGPVALDARQVATWLPWSARLLRACLPAPLARGRAALRALQADALPAWERLDASLPGDTLLQREGTTKLWEGPQAAARAEAASRADCGTARPRRLSEAECARIAARLRTPIGAGVHYADTAHITAPRTVLDRLADAFVAAGGTWHHGTVSRLIPFATGVAVAIGGDTLQADAVLVAGGVTSGRLLPELCIPMIAERGYHLEWDHGGDYALPNLVFEDRALVVTRFGTRLRATSFVEFTRDDAPPDPRKWQAIGRHIRELGLPVAGEPARWHGSRPTLPDYLPMLGATARQPRILTAFGHNHLGLTLAPTTAERLAAHLLGGAPLPAALSPDRFQPRTKVSS